MKKQAVKWVSAAAFFLSCVGIGVADNATPISLEQSSAFVGEKANLTIEIGTISSSKTSKNHKTSKDSKQPIKTSEPQYKRIPCSRNAALCTLTLFTEDDNGNHIDGLITITNNSNFTARNVQLYLPEGWVDVTLAPEGPPFDIEGHGTHTFTITPHVTGHLLAYAHIKGTNTHPIAVGMQILTYGDTWQGGKIYFYEADEVAGVISGLIAAPRDITSPIQWGEMGILTGANSNDDGNYNTDKICNTLGCSSTAFAAAYCREGEKEVDPPVVISPPEFFLPAEGQLAELQSLLNDSPELADTFNIHPSAHYWLSKEDNLNYAKDFKFEGATGTVGSSAKSTALSVRCINSFHVP